MGYGGRLKKILKENKVTVKEVSRYTGIPATTLYSIIKRDNEHVSVDYTIEISKAICEYLKDARDVSLDYKEIQYYLVFGSENDGCIHRRAILQEEKMRSYKEVLQEGKEVESAKREAIEQITLAIAALAVAIRKDVLSKVHDEIDAKELEEA